MAKIGERIKLARASLGMTQEQLAEKVGVETPSVSRWESGVSKPRPRHMPAIAKALGKQTDWFLQSTEGLEAIQKRITALEEQAGSPSIPAELWAAWKNAEGEKWRRQVALFFLTSDPKHLEREVPEKVRAHLLSELRVLHKILPGAKGPPPRK